MLDECYLGVVLPLDDGGRAGRVLDRARDVDGAAHVHEHLGLPRDRRHRSCKQSKSGLQHIRVEKKLQLIRHMLVMAISVNSAQEKLSKEEEGI